MKFFKKRRARLAAIIVFLLFLLFAGIGWFYYQYRFYSCPSKARYSTLGISIPTGYSIHGIDVSRYQQTIDWEAVSEMNVQLLRLDFGFMKATEGLQYTDPQFERNWRMISRTRMVRGAYHYFKPQLSGRQQAEHFIRQVRLLPGDLPPVLDVEELGGVTPQQLVEGVREWIVRLEQHYKVKPIIYSNAKFYNRYLLIHFSAYPLWVAHYYERCVPRVFAGWSFWQHNDRGRVNGISTGVDFNVFNGSRAAFNSLRIPPTIRR
ncbi:MAG: glycoside hydrolase family 25 protein [Bacteroidetes bacterium]|nr:glycoside hydrolase family 25 protein [Bacteroidota bacterium]